MALAFRRIEDDDIEGVAAIVAEAFARYRAFAPPGWEPPPAESQVEILRGWLYDPGFWGYLATDPVLVGHATFIPAERHSTRPEPAPGVAHLGHLFVEPRRWGSGLASELLGRALDASASRGFRELRLFVPRDQARARRFYEREGFARVGEPFETALKLPLLEYGRSLGSDNGVQSAVGPRNG